MTDSKIRVDKEDLEAFRELFARVACSLEGDDALVQECEQTAEFIVGFYLLYPAAPALIILPDLGALFAWIVDAQEFHPLTGDAKQAVDALIQIQQKGK